MDTIIISPRNWINQNIEMPTLGYLYLWKPMSILLCMNTVNLISTELIQMWFLVAMVFGKKKNPVQQ